MNVTIAATSGWTNPRRLCRESLSFVLCVVCLSSGSVRAQGTRADYERASHLRELTRGKVFQASVEPHWFAGNEKFWYANALADGKREIIVVDAVKGTREKVSEAPTATTQTQPATRPSTQPRRRRRSAGGADSPDGKWSIIVKDENLVLRSKATGDEFPLSDDGKAADGNETI